MTIIIIMMMTVTLSWLRDGNTAAGIISADDFAFSLSLAYPEASSISSIMMIMMIVDLEGNDDHDDELSVCLTQVTLVMHVSPFLKQKPSHR